jgi:hypothetical protein
MALGARMRVTVSVWCAMAKSPRSHGGTLSADRDAILSDLQPGISMPNGTFQAGG